MIKITAVSYLNTKPFIYGLYKSNIAQQIDLQLDMPARCAEKLISGEADLALMPVGAIPDLKEKYWIVSDYCIGADGQVKTVCLFSQVPLNEIRQIYLDFHSRTSVELTRLLCRDYWKIKPEFLPASEGFMEKISGTTAGLIIGDKAMGLENRFPYIYDLAEAWKMHKNLPFVFAAWVSNRPLEADFLAAFNAALKTGLDAFSELVKILPQVPNFDLEDYFRNCISYELDEAKKLALRLFLSEIVIVR